MNLAEAKKIVAEAIKNNTSRIDLSSNLDDSEKLSDSDMTELVPEILKLKDLKAIELRNNHLTVLDKNFAQLKKLQVLNLENNHLTTFDKEFANLQNLQRLDLTSNRLIAFNKDLAKLTTLKYLFLSDNQLTEFDKEFASLENLIQLFISRNKLTTFDKAFAKLTKLRELLLWNNQITAFDKEFAKLENLRELKLDNNRLTTFDKEFAKLENLAVLNLSGNPLPFPVEILVDERNPRKILNFIVEYYEAQEKGTLKPLNEAKLVVVGEANVGKTCVINRLIYNKFDKTDSTHGIEIHRWENVELEDGQTVQLNVWDFGGQEIMHSTHQFFFTKRTVYILVINARENQENNKTEEWLQRIKNLSQDSPVFIVGNKIDENNRGTDRMSIGYFDIDRTNLNNKFPTLIKGFYGISSDVSKIQYDFLFEDFKKALTLEIGQLKEIHKEFPANWFDIKAQLEKMREDKIPYIKFRDYLARCIKAEIENEESQRTLIEFMHDLGIALSFQDDKELRDLAVLNPEWVTRGVYALIDNAQIALRHGVLERENIGKFLNENEYPRGETQDFIIKMMRKFKLLVDIEKDIIFLLPDLLPKDEPDTGNWDNALHFQYGYEIYEKSILRSFIVEMYPMRSKETYWRNGIVLVKGTNRALVKADVLSKQIAVKIEGNPNTRREFLAIIRREFDKIHGKFASMTVEEKVGHPIIKVPDEKDPNKKNEILKDYKELLNMETDGEIEIYVNELRQKIPIKDFLDGVESAEERIKNREKRRSEERENFKPAEKVDSAVKVREDLALIESKRAEIGKLENEINKTNADISNYDELARKMTRFYSIGSFLLLAVIIAAWIYFVLSLDWNFLEPKTYILPILAMLFSYGVSAWTLREWNPFKFPEQRFEKEKGKLYEKFGVNLEEHKLKCSRLTKSKMQLKP